MYFKVHVQSELPPQIPLRLVPEDDGSDSWTNKKKLSIREKIERKNKKALEYRFAGIGGRIDSDDEVEGESIPSRRKESPSDKRRRLRRLEMNEARMAEEARRLEEIRIKLMKKRTVRKKIKAYVSSQTMRWKNMVLPPRAILVNEIGGPLFDEDNNVIFVDWKKKRVLSHPKLSMPFDDLVEIVW
jgi:hypothetical protein